jgi:hypothetical protein
MLTKSITMLLIRIKPTTISYSSKKNQSLQPIRSTFKCKISGTCFQMETLRTLFNKLGKNQWICKTCSIKSTTLLFNKLPYLITLKLNHNRLLLLRLRLLSSFLNQFLQFCQPPRKLLNQMKI